MTITLFGAIGTLISFSVISLGKLFSSLNFTWHVLLCSSLSLVHSITGSLGLISRLNIGSLDLGDYLGQFLYEPNA